MRRYRIQLPGTGRKMVKRETVADVVAICLRYREGVSHGFLGPVEPLMKQFGVQLYEIAEPDCLFLCFTPYTHKNWEGAAKVFYVQAVNAMQAHIAGAGYAKGRERLYPDERGRDVHLFPDGDICRESYKRSFGETFS